MPKWLKAIIKLIPKKWIMKKVAKLIDDRVMPELKQKAAEFGKWFSTELRKLAKKGSLNADTAEEVEKYMEEIDKAFWTGANLDD